MSEPESSDWHPAEVAAALKMCERPWTLRALSLANDYSANAANIALRKQWPAVEQIIADALGLTPQEIWPSRYDESGSPLRRRPHTRGAA